jgi:hypothetical protein
VYKVAEENLAQVRDGDGISYSIDNSLVVQLAFKSERDCMSFQSSIRKIPLSRKRKMDASDVHIEDEIVAIHPNGTIPLKRVFADDYQKIEGDANPSEDCDGYSVASSSLNTAVEVDDMVKLQLLDDENSRLLIENQTEKCHLKSQTAFPEHKNNKNNIVYATRHLHEHFDGINKADGVPHFVLKYHSHSNSKIAKSVNGKQIFVCETVVRVEFINEKLKEALAIFFKNGYVLVSTTEIEFTLYFQNPNEFRLFAKYKEEETRLKWQSLRGVDE